MKFNIFFKTCWNSIISNLFSSDSKLFLYWRLSLDHTTTRGCWFLLLEVTLSKPSLFFLLDCFDGAPFCHESICRLRHAKTVECSYIHKSMCRKCFCPFFLPLMCWWIYQLCCLFLLEFYSKNKWQPKGQIDLELGAKGFFVVVFANLEDKTRVFEMDHISSILQGYLCGFGKNNIVQRKRISLQS